MTDQQTGASNALAAKLARLVRAGGGFPVLSSEKRQDYEERLISLLEDYRPRKFAAERLVKYLTDEEWEIDRYRRHKIFLIERRFHARLNYQAFREKAAQQDKALLAKTLAERQATPFTLPEEAVDGLVAEVDAMLQRPAEELDHARALEVGIVYFQHLDRLLNAAMVRRKAILDDIARYEAWFDPAPALSGLLEEVHRSAHDLDRDGQAGEAQPAQVEARLVPGQEERS